MPDEFKVNKKLGIIEIRSYGVETEEDIAGSVTSALEVYEKTGINKVIIDATQIKEVPGIIDTFKLFSSMPRQIVQAIVATKDQVNENELIFAETVAVNRGIGLKIFYDRQDALNWLKEQ